MNNGNTLKRLLSALVAALMIFGLIPAGHIASSVRSASAEPVSSSVVNGRYVDGQWVEGGNGSITHNIDGTDVTLSKTAEPVPGQENTYKVTLKVETTTSTSQVVSSEQGAVVLVIDLSNSMNYCAECGGKTRHKDSCSHSGYITEEQMRLYAAKEAAKNFLKTYSGSDASAKRLLAIAVFNTNYSTKLDWTNVAGVGSDGYNAAVNVINGLKTPTIDEDGGTNLEGGLYQAYQLLGASVLNSITAKHVVLLTDGAPTLCMTSGSGTSGSATYNNAAKNRANQIKNLGATLHAVCFGAANDYTYVEESWFNTEYGPKVGDFLEDDIASPGCYYNAENADQLTVAFQEIVDEITTGLSGEGWTVTDPMGSAVDFVSGPENFTLQNGETYKWELADAQTSEDGNTTTYIYTCTYTITIDPQTIGFVEGQYYPTNGPTYLNIGDESYAFPVPGVTGCFPRTSVTARKVWNDNDNQDGIRPDSVKLQLMKDGEAYGDPVTVSGSSWSYTWTDLIAMANGVTVNYTVKEIDVPTGYTATYGTENGKLIVTNTHAVEKTSITVKKVWDDNNDQDGIRPSSITVALKNGNTQVATGSLTAANGWEYTFEGVDKYANGQLINYTVAEINVPAGYTPSVNGLVITNTHVITKTSVSVTKVWNDDNNRDGVRPNDVTVRLYANGTFTGKTLILSEGNNWHGEFTELDKNHNGSAIAYTVDEVEIEGYTASVTGSQANGYKITNTHVPAVVTVAGHKIWMDNNNQDGARPASITVNLVKDGQTIATKVVTAGDDWAWTFENLPKYENGTLINYSVVENAVEDYSTTYDGFNIINTHTPAKTSLTVTKTWNDNFDQDGIRPNDITVKLLANGVETGTVLVLNIGNNWTGSFTELDKFIGGTPVVYTIAEVSIPGYTSEITGDQVGGYTITNTHVPAAISVSGHKIWDDNNNQDGARPASITINLVKNGQVIDTKVVTAADGWAWTFENLPKFENGGTLINYSITEAAVEGYTTTYNGYDVINAHAPEMTSVTVTKAWADNNNQDGIRPNDVTVALFANGVPTGKTLVLSAGNSWTGSFTDLDKFMGGTQVAYTVSEVEIPGYASVITGTQEDGYTITNSHTPAVVSVCGQKEWDDNNNQDGVRPESITVNLIANGKVVDTKVVTAADNWAWCFTNLPKFENGTAIVYTFGELHVEGYVTTYEDGVIKNVHAPAKTSVNVTKAWADNNNQDGSRPNHVTVTLFANGVDTGKTLVLNAGNNWAGSFNDLDKYMNGSEIVYTVAEAPVPGYETVITGTAQSDFTITNSHTPAVTTVCGHKIWEDKNNQDGARPASITITLLKNGQVYDTIVVTAADDWSWCFENLPKYENGMLINYSVVEAAVEGYVTTYCGNNITNCHAPAKTSVTVTKAWADNNDQDGLRPNHVTVALFANGMPTGKTLTLSSGNNWTGSFTDLDKYVGGVKVVYTVSEVNVPGYVSVISGDQENGYTITNSHTPCVVEVCGHKEWFDNNNQDGVRPESITVNLLADGVVVDSKVVTAADNWSWCFTNLPKYQNGHAIVYTFGEIHVDGYITTYCCGVIKNVHCPEKTAVNVNKVWADNNNQDGIRPVKVVVELIANGVPTGKFIELSSMNDWTGAFTDLDKYFAGAEIAYTVVEAPVPGYETVISGNQADGYTITNSHIPCVTTVCGHKTWMDNNDQDGARPESITITLLANGEVYDVKVVTAADNWSWCFENLPKYENGKLIVYTVVEAAVEGYYTTYCGYNVTNCHAPAKTSVTVTKAWADNNNQDGIRPNSVKIELFANGVPTGKFIVLSAANNWTGAFTELDKYFAGSEIVYTVVEAPVPGYETVISGSQEEGYVVTNSHIPCVTEVCGHKEWFDNNNQDGVRPESITIHLLANGIVVDTKVVTAADNWSWCFTNLPKFLNGAPIIYTVVEEPVEGYMTTYCCGVIKNTHCPEKTSITVTKVWDDNDDQDGIRPGYVTVHLYANGVDTGMTLVLTYANWWTGTFFNLDKYMNGQLIEYTVVEDPVPGYETTILPMRCEGFVITNTHCPEVVDIAGNKVWDDNNNQDGVRPESITINLLKNGVVIDTIIVTAEDGWAWSFTDLPKYENHGTLINYTVTEGAVDGYYTTYEGGTITNVHAPEKTAVTVVKAWDDNFDQDGVRPNDITVTLLANGEDTGMTLVLNEGNNWMGSFVDLDKYMNGVEIVYTVAEITVPGYETVISGNQYDGYSIVNVHVPEVVAISGTKTWMDNDNQDGVRPEAITINLLANGIVIDTITVTAEDGWAWSFTDLPKYENHGTLITYSITEEAVEGYVTTYNNYNVVNEHAPEKTSVTVTKAWDDAGNQDGIRPYIIEVTLLANGEDTGLTLTLGSGNNWTGSFTDLDKYMNGVEIVYTVAEVAVEGYESIITGSQAEGYIITNVHTPELIDIEGAKTWNDNNDQDGARPESITINLLANGIVIDTITVTAEDGWAWSFTNLPKYEAEGVEIVYTITENVVDDYSTEIDGYNIINKHTPAKTSVTVVKSWQDNNDQDGIRPESVTVELIANGEPTGKTVVLNAENNWTATFSELDKFANGVEIVYTVAEVTVEGYTTVITGNQIEGFVVTNSHTPETIEIAGAKTWNDNNNQDGARPESITINLLADGDVIETVEVTAEDGWTWSFTDLPKYRDGGVEIVYSIVEVGVEGYSTEYDGYNVINSYTPEEISITVTKAWENDNTKPKNSGHRVPVTIQLFADGEYVTEIVLSEETNWTGSFTGLPKYKDGQLIKYTVEELMEDALAEYYTVIINGNVEEGFVITNTHVPVTGDERTAPTKMVNIMIISGITAIAGLAVLAGSLMGFKPASRKRKNER